MSAEETRSAPSKTSFPDRLRSYTNSLARQDELAELVLQLSAYQGSGSAAPPSDPGLLAMADATGLDWSPASVTTAIVALGERARQLAARRQSEIEGVGPRDLDGLARVLLAQLEAVRIADSSADEDTFAASADAALKSYRRNAPPRSDEDRAWRERVERAVRRRFVPAYSRAALALNRIEDGRSSGRLLRYPWALGLLCALPGLLTMPFPVSTPLVCLALGLFGAYVLHPAWLRFLATPLRASVENLVAEGPLLDRLSAATPWTEEHLRLRSVVEALLPMLESTRGAGRVSEEQCRAVVSDALQEIEPHVDESGASTESFGLVRRYCEGRLAREFARYAQARQRWEGGMLVRVVDQPALSALVFGVLTLPLAALSSLATPLPPAVDFPLMVLLFLGVGSQLPRLLPGTLPARESLLTDAEAHQQKLERLA